MRRFYKLHLLYFVFCIIYGCAPSIAAYDNYAYTQITSLKVETLHLMDMATEPLDNHKQEVKALTMQLEKTKEYVIHRKNNIESGSMWEILLDTNQGSFGEFISFWHRQNIDSGKNLSPTYIARKKKIVGEHFDIIAELESKKSKEKK